MKTLAFLLLLTNIGFYVWLQGMLPWLPWQPAQYESKPQHTQVADNNAERLMLLSERDMPLLETIAPEKMRLADNDGLLEDKKPRTLRDEAQVTEEADSSTPIVLAENTPQEEPKPIGLTPTNLRTMTAIHRMTQIPAPEEEETEQVSNSQINASTSTHHSVLNVKPSETSPDNPDLGGSIKKLSVKENIIPKTSETDTSQPKEEMPKTLIAMADTAKPEKEASIITETKSENIIEKEIDLPKETSVDEKLEPATDIQKEQQAGDFFARLAQTVQRVGNTFKRVSSDVFNERVTVPPELAEKPEPKPPVELPKPKEEPPKELKIATVAKSKPKPVKQVCYEIGSYASIKQLNKHANWLKLRSKDIKTFIDTKTIKEVDKVRVYIAPNERVPAAQQQLIAQNIIVRLRHDGVSDMRVMSGSALKNSISLGVFNSYANAQRRANAIKAKGYANVQLKNYYQQKKKYWLIAKMPQTEQIITNKFKKTFKQVRLDKMQNCK